MNHKRFPLLLASMVFMFGLATPASAQSVIRDAEIESYMQEWFDPIFAAAGMQSEQVKIIIVNDSDLNAFVAGGANIFFYTGLIEKTDNPGELIGVMAHELGHISGGHLVRARVAMEKASYESIIGMIIGVGTAIATGDGGAASAIGGGANSMAQRGFLATARTYESSADQAALSSMEKAEINPNGFMSFMKKLESQEFLESTQQSEYVRTHPLTRDRVDSIRVGVERSPFRDKAYPAEWTEQHARMKAKLLGYLNPGQIEWTYDVTDKSLPAQYARAVADYRQNHVDKALGEVDALIALEPDNPYFYELKGQMLVDFGRVEAALPSYQKALSLKPNSGLIRTALAHAQIETAGNDRAKLTAAKDNLERAMQDEPRSTQIHRLLATAYGRMGNDPVARLHLAEEALLQQKTEYAKQQAEIALKGLEKGSRQWLRAQDILTYIEQEKG